VTFPAASHVYGIPEHASTHALRATDGSEGAAYTQPYRLYNLDVFEYELDNPMALYGSIPFLLAHGAAGATAGVYWNNPTETYVDIKKGMRGAGRGVGARWVSESGVFDVSLVPGPSPKAAVSQFTSLVGTQALPPLFALGYHQCRWNYRDEADVFGVDAKFEDHNFPYDVLWLDIEHTDGKRYFTWDKALFPNPAAMQEKLAARGRKMVTIIDPHIKRDAGYRIHSDAQAKGLYVRNAQGGEYDGWCWPGSSSYLDFTSLATRDWWADQFALDKYAGSTLSLYTWVSGRHHERLHVCSCLAVFLSL
jgi:alpha 1,3-glucosidase